MKIKLLPFFAFMFVLCVLLAACGKSEEPAEEANPIEPDEFHMQSIYPYTMGIPDHPFAITEKGAYYRAYLQYDPVTQKAIAHLMYLNFETMELELADDSPVNELFFPFRFDDHLYEVMANYDKDGTSIGGSATRTNLSGTEKVEIKTDLQITTPITGYYIFDGTYVYFMAERPMDTQDPRNRYGNAAETAYLVRADFERGELVALLDFDAYSQYTTISGIYKDGVILKIDTIPAKKPAGASEYIGDYALQEDRAVSYYAVPLFEEEISIQPYDYTQHGTFGLKGNEFSFTDWAEFKNYYFPQLYSSKTIECFDYLSGETTTIDWNLNTSENVLTFPRIVGATSDCFLVVRDFLSFDDCMKGFMTRRYALIKKDDYLNSEPNFIEFDYSVMHELTSQFPPLEQ